MYLESKASALGILPKLIIKTWHRAFAELLRELFTPLDIAVFPEVPVMSQPPQVDILLFRREQAVWTAEQFERLPDGIRQCNATYILLEFMLEREGLPLIPEPLESLLSGLRLLKGEQEMRELTPEEVQELGRKWGKHYLSRLSPEERLAGISTKKRLAGIPSEERLAGITLPEVFRHFKPEEIRAYLRSLK